MHNQPLPSVVHLNRYYHFTELMRDPTIEGQLLRYQSDYDGAAQTILILQPADSETHELFFFFHGMDGDRGDGVVLRELVKRLKAKVVCLGGRGPAWVSDAFLSDAEQVIRTYARDVKMFHLAGVSMGATQALALAGLLPNELRQMIAGVLALIPGVNLPAIVARSAHDRVKNTLHDSAKGNLDQLQQRSPVSVMAGYPEHLPFVIFHNRDDTLLLAGELRDFVEQLRRRGHKVASFSDGGDHNFTYSNFDFARAMQSLGHNETENEPPLLRVPKPGSGGR
jgi:pimeloyl-ACP methyl ester carboxylesterase